MIKLTTWAVTVLTLAGLCGCARSSTVDSRRSQGVPSTAPTKRTIRVELEAGRFPVDLYLPPGDAPVPLVVVAHGFSRQKANMRGWGEHLAAEGFAVAVPTLPAWSDHARNGRAVAQLIEWLLAAQDTAGRLDAKRVGVMGFSAGGLATFLAAGESGRVTIWIGLDPVDRDGLAVRAAPRVRCKTLTLRAEPSACNARGNWAAVEAAQPSTPGRVLTVNNAVHVDCEWPTDFMAEMACGNSTPQCRAAFVDYATAGLRAELLDDESARGRLDRAGEDERVREAAPPAP
jgi:dienelactone hydrolase